MQMRFTFSASTSGQKCVKLTKVNHVHHDNWTDYCQKCEEYCHHTTYSSTNFLWIFHDDVKQIFILIGWTSLLLYSISDIDIKKVLIMSTGVDKIGVAVTFSNNWLLKLNIFMFYMLDYLTQHGKGPFESLKRQKLKTNQNQAKKIICYSFIFY